jgi:hypothetical protein
VEQELLTLETNISPIPLVGLLRGREPGTALAWWVLTGRAPYRLIVVQKGYLTGKRNCRNSYMKTMLRSVAFRKHTCKMVNLLKSEDTKFSGVIQKETRGNKGTSNTICWAPSR